MSFVVDFRTVGNHITQDIVTEVRIEFLPNHVHEFKFSDSSNHSHVQEHEVRMLHEVCSMQIVLKNVNNANGR